MGSGIFSRSINYKKKFELRKKQGICTKCGIAASRKEQNTCKTCGDRASAQQKAWRSRPKVRIDYGDCVVCGNPIPEYRAKAYSRMNIITCSKPCSRRKKR